MICWRNGEIALKAAKNSIQRPKKTFSSSFLDVLGVSTTIFFYDNNNNNNESKKRAKKAFKTHI